MQEEYQENLYKVGKLTHTLEQGPFFEIGRIMSDIEQVFKCFLQLI